MAGERIKILFKRRQCKETLNWNKQNIDIIDLQKYIKVIDFTASSKIMEIYISNGKNTL